MNESAIINADAAISKFWNAIREIVHFLQSHPRQMQVSGEAEFVLTVGDTTDRRIVLRATVPIMDHHRYISLLAKLLQRKDEFAANGASLAMGAREFASGKVSAQITHIKNPASPKCYSNDHEHESPVPLSECRESYNTSQ